MSASKQANPPAGHGAVDPVAIIGIGCLFPKANDLGAYWANIKNGVDAITEIPPTHWRPEDHFDADPKAPDRTYGKRGGFLSPYDFDPMEFGMLPSAIEATDTSQLLGMVAAQRALADAGYGKNRDFDRDRVSVVLGVTGALELVIPLGARLEHPKWRKSLKDAGVDDAVAEDVIQRIADSYVPWQENSFPGLLGNVVAGRISKHLDLGGTNCVVDAACAGSLGAIHLAMLELSAGHSDMVVTGGVDTFNDVFMYLCFSKTLALSKAGDARPFDANGDGTILGEGLGMLVLKRLADAQRDNDTVYAVIRAIGSSSDGKGDAIYAPSAPGQVRALKRAYEHAGIAPQTVELVEGHGTGTIVGDAVEVSALSEVYGEAQNGPWCALGSVKSQIGHTKAAAGAAGLIKAALALHHKVLPPTIKVSQPPEILTREKTPFYVNTQKRPWLPRKRHPRRAALSALGFGGSNFHCVIEEHGSVKTAVDWDGNVELLAFSADSRNALEAMLADFEPAASWDGLQQQAAAARASFRTEQPLRLLIVLQQNESDAGKLLATAREALQRDPQKATWTSPQGIYFSSGPKSGKLAFLFPGQGAQYPYMLRDLACQFPAMLDALITADRAFANGAGQQRLSDLIYPHPAFDKAAKQAQEQRLQTTQHAQPAIGAVSVGALKVLASFGVHPEAVAGHSYGELTALYAAGRLDEETLYRLSKVRGTLMAQGGKEKGTMMAVRAPLDVVAQALEEAELDVIIANKNAPEQAVLSGSHEAIGQAESVFRAKKITCKVLSVAAAFHSRLVADAQQPFRKALDGAAFADAKIPVYANTTAQEYPNGAAETRELLASQLASPVEFTSEIEHLHDAGVRTFVEVGPGARLTGLVRAILSERDHQAFAMDSSAGKRSGTVDLAHTLASLASLGCTVDLAKWNEGVVTVQPESGRKKPRMTVPICGANYVTPRAAKPPKTRAAASGPPPQSKPPSPAPAPPQVAAPKPTQHAAALPPAPGPAAPAMGPPASHLEQALRSTQESMAALQRMQEQTAQLHGQFLEGQQAAANTFQMLLEQQRVLLAGGAVMPAATPTPVPAPVTAPSPPLETAAPAVVAAPAPEAPAPALETPQAPAEAVPEAGRRTRIEQVLLETIAEKTGYPAEMLELDMSLDSDLGIDSIKRVEILSTIKEQLPDAPEIGAQHLGELQTLQDIAAYLAEDQGKAAPTATQESHGAHSEEQIASVLLNTIAEKTGYPVDMLELDMALDADLGIDSIKRVEILSAIKEQLPDAPEIGAEQLGKLQTPAQIVAYLASADGASEPPKQAPEKASSAPVAESRTEAPLEGRVLRAVELGVPASGTPVRLSKEAPLLITDDGSGLAAAVVARFNARGHQARQIPVRAFENEAPEALGGLLILAPEAGTDNAFLIDAFKLLQWAGPALRRTGKHAGAGFATVSRLDGGFGSLREQPLSDPLSGGLAGLAKTAYREWPEVHCKALDLGGDFGSAEQAAEALVAELFVAGSLETGLSHGKRWGLELAFEPIAEADGDTVIDAGDVVLVTGGARGVTAAVAVELAQRCQPLLVLLGRSAPPHDEPAWLVGLEGEAAIKRALAERGNGGLTPKKLSEECHRIQANREILANIARMQKAGAQVHYRSVDIRQATQVSGVLEEVQRKWGPVKALIHGAGVLADRLIEDKTEEQFAQVYATKVAGLQNVLEHLAPDVLRALVLFSSSTGRYGRKGQIDYAVANEVLNKIAQQESRRRPDCRVVALNWGPWGGGMVTPALRRVFEAEGVGLIALDAGARFLWREMLAADRAAEVVAIAGEHFAEEAGHSAAVEKGDLEAAFSLDLDLERYPVLKSHIIKGHAVVPAALMIEWMAQGAMHCNPGLHFHGLDEFRICKGVRLLAGESCPVNVLTGKAAQHKGLFRAPVELRGRDSGVLHATAAVVLAAALPKDNPTLSEVPLESAAYNNGGLYNGGRLFHGPDLQSLKQVDAGANHRIVAQIHSAPPPGRWMQKPLRKTWLADPLALDSSFQMMILWSLQQYGVGSLPSHLRAYRQFARKFPKNGVRIVVQVTEHNPHHAEADVEFLDPQSNKLVARITGYECTLDASLNQAFQENVLLQASGAKAGER